MAYLIVPCADGPGKLAGTRRLGAVPSDNREGEESEGEMLPYELVHGCLARPVRAARRRVPLMGYIGEVLGDPVCQRAPGSWTGSAWLGRLYSQFVCFNGFNQFRGVYNRRHDHPPCPRMLPMRMGAASCGARPYRRHGVRPRGRDSPQWVCSIPVSSLTATVAGVSASFVPVPCPRSPGAGRGTGLGTLVC